METFGQLNALPERPRLLVQGYCSLDPRPRRAGLPTTLAPGISAAGRQPYADQIFGGAFEPPTLKMSAQKVEVTVRAVLLVDEAQHLVVRPGRFIPRATTRQLGVAPDDYRRPGRPVYLPAGWAGAPRRSPWRAAIAAIAASCSIPPAATTTFAGREMNRWFRRPM
jgi:hypothetical protein